MPGPADKPGAGNATEIAQFANAVAAQTGLDPRVVIAWGEIETGGQANSHNWLNLRPYPGDPYSGVSSGNFEQFNSVQDAITASVRRIKQPFAAPIVASAGKPPAQEIAAIASTGWDAGHYGGAGGPNLLREFNSLYPNAATGPAQKTPASGVGAPTGVDIPNPIAPITDAFHSIEGALTFLTSWRFAEVLGGFALLLVGLVLLGKQFGISPPAAVPVPV